MNNIKIPKHIGIIMDGNGRWGIKHYNSRIKGHKQGVISLENCIKNCIEFNLKALSVYAFSTENWKRSSLEVQSLLKLFDAYLKSKKEELNEQGIRLVISGSREKLSNNLIKTIDETVNYLKENKKFILNICFNYGGRKEIVDAVNTLISKGVENITELDISKHLYSPFLEEPDLIIRTGGDIRLSNFLIWQSSYSELYFSNKLWPDFDKEELKNAILDYEKRNRRFGGTNVK
ncbi:polyprenyl diphosphate synthase [Oceanivirga salmonicida]|uniref:polyprenyl diphosphate synthase n=1 Tax=Oceanivirga salmonicida TaxID=1769291 RepID=UPI0008299052|nr:polyprenyl diphosphate synthase [Oceanivirga salmonicida]